MNNLDKLISKAYEKECRLLIQFDPEEIGEHWGVKFYPDLEDDAHFYAYHNELEEASRQLLDELRGAFKW